MPGLFVRSEVEQLAEQALLLFVPVVVLAPVAGIIVAVTVILLVPVVVAGRRGRGTRRFGWRRLRDNGRRALDDLVELTAIQPHAAALRAVVDLDALAVGHDQGDVAGGTLHGVAPVWIPQ